MHYIMGFYLGTTGPHGLITGTLQRPKELFVVLIKLPKL